MPVFRLTTGLVVPLPTISVPLELPPLSAMRIDLPTLTVPSMISILADVVTLLALPMMRSLLLPLPTLRMPPFIV